MTDIHTTKTYCLALDLKDDPLLMAEYEKWHENIWPEIVSSIRNAGITDMNIYRTGNRLLMVMEVNSSFSLEAKANADAASQRVQEWEALMWNYQQALPWAKPGEKWILMQHIFKLPE